MSLPCVNILLSTYNDINFIEEQIQSLQAQADVNITISIRDDGSNRQTRELLRKISQSNENIELNLAENIGLPDSFFSLMQKQRNKNYDYYAFCDQDDIWPPDKLIGAIRKLHQAQNPIALYCSRQTYINEKGFYIGESFTPKKPLNIKNAMLENIAVGCTCVFTPKLLEKATQSNDYTNIVMHDWWVYLIGITLGEVIFDASPSTLYRQHSNNVIGGKLSHWKKFKLRIRKYKDLKQLNKGGPINQLQKYTSEHSNFLSSENTQLIKRVLEAYNSNIFKRIYIAYNSSYFYRQTFIDHIIWKLLFILKML